MTRPDLDVLRGRFLAYAQAFAAEDPGQESLYRLKIEHTLRVLALAQEISREERMDRDAAASRLLDLIEKALTDPNISSLLLGAILLEDELYVKRKDSEIRDDPVFLLSDEIIGMAIAECIGGTYARFEFTRYDQKKPGILGTLGPFLDDAVAGLIAGCTSRLYSESS